MPYVTVIEVMTIVPNPENSEDFDERQTLLVECKRPSRDTPLEWHEGQFEDDLTENLNASGRLFGAVAIGKKVRFYQFNGKAPAGQKLAQLHRDTIHMSTDSGIIEVERMMNYIKANAWQ
ncbi:hypothetical protein PENDEC_c010G00167 [Penicillium decumbens]|uniref:Uncharacterized protein n=1 Tax=Penicillium decumbens TaxID=69771 RepID=A0A1V6PD20_PENDC|nr:hypothetical protein PENDEC_c010G00167 [Penicillium decumbens]